MFVTIPRIVTKPIAYRLIEKYGSLLNVISAPKESLMESGLSEISAMHLRFVYELRGRVRKDSIKGRFLGGYDAAGEYLKQELGADKTERLVMLLLDGAGRVVDVVTVCNGSFRSADVDMRLIAEQCAIKKPAGIILAHNHPSGSSEASFDDNAATHNIEYFVNQMGIELLEHYIVTETGYEGIKHKRNEALCAQQEIYEKTYGGFKGI